MGSLHHPAHDHALNLRLLSKDFIRLLSKDYNRFSFEKFCCQVCSNKIQDSTYCCEECSNFFLHKSCAELPSDIQHPFHHQHPLKMFVNHLKYRRIFDVIEPKKCDACKQDSLTYFDCSDCGNRFCSNCIVNTMPNEDSHTRPADNFTTHHFSHHHPLKSFNVVGKLRAITCQVCKEYIGKGEAYGCYKCGHFLHKNCAGFSQELRHPFHPKHPLTLLFDPPHGSECNACGNRSSSSVYVDSKGWVYDYSDSSAYSCGQCQFSLHLACAISTKDFEVSDDRVLFIDHFSHQHRLKSFLVKWKSKIQCDACLENISGETYGCADCMFFVHKSCTQVPPRVEHPLHEEHSLALVPKSAYGSASLRCSSCDDSISEYAFAFSCQEVCEFVLDVKCALETLTYLNQGGLVKIESRLHDHPLELCIREGTYPECEVCYGVVSEGLSYKCSLKECRFRLHRSCADFPLEIMQHPSHPQHTLTFHSKPRPYHCSACFTSVRSDLSLGDGFFCAECDFKLDFLCASQNLTFKHPLHEHSLLYFGEIEVRSQTSSPPASPNSRLWASPCKACGKSCSVDLYRCVQCNFNIHTDCLQKLQLPPKIKHPKHFHQLTLGDSFVEDDYGEYVCEFCGKDRHPKLGVYYCEECPRESKVTIHIECAVDEIPEKLKTDARLAIARLDKEIKTLQAQVDAVDQELDAVAKKRDALTKRRAALTKKVDEVKREQERLL